MAGDWLAFIDTNVLLDFYRMEGSGAAEDQLKFIDKNRDRIITSDQVRMEYMKNRQATIIKTLSGMKSLDGTITNLPPVLVNAKPASQIKKLTSQIKTQQKKIRERIERMLIDPVHNDGVYQCVQRLFKQKSDLNLTRSNKIRFEIRELAQKRFMLGYPPRKPGDNSIGDALNWEWIVHCANQNASNVVIVSRDADYGPSHAGKAYINDWLAHEFKSRVHKQRQAILTPRVTDAMKQLKLSVPEQLAIEEEKFLKFLEGIDYEEGEKEIAAMNAMLSGELRPIRNLERQLTSMLERQVASKPKVQDS